MADRKKVIDGLLICLNFIDEQDCPESCPYFDKCQEYEGRVMFQPLMRDALSLLKEQPEIVRCKECKNCEYPDSEKE